uniref:Uncharacterized protein n=1 Tax=Bursaphelenchus xylophilus TaxID=6326 RepID=A0A1I7SBG3_BURXY
MDSPSFSRDPLPEAAAFRRCTRVIMARGSAEKGRKSRTTIGTRKAETRGRGVARRKYTEGANNRCSVEKQTTANEAPRVAIAAKFVHKGLPKDSGNSVSLRGLHIACVVYGLCTP